jgi:hypothetical protein
LPHLSLEVLLMGAINTSRSNIKNTSRTANGTEYGADVAIEVNEKNGQVTAKITVSIHVNGKTEKHEFQVEGTRA